MKSTTMKLRGVDDILSFIDSRTGIKGRAGVIRLLDLGGLVL